MHASIDDDSPLHVHCFVLARSLIARVTVMEVSVSRPRSRTTMIAIKLPTMVASAKDERTNCLNKLIRCVDIIMHS